MNRTVDAFAALQASHEHTDKRLQALQAHQEEAASRIEALEASLAAQGGAEPPTPKPAQEDAAMAEVLRRLELLESTKPTPASSTGTASGPTTPPGDAFTGRAGPPQRDLYSYDRRIIRIYSDVRVPREVVLPELQRLAKQAGVPTTAYNPEGPPLSTMHTAVLTGHETKAADIVTRILRTLREDDGTYRAE